MIVREIFLVKRKDSLGFYQMTVLLKGSQSGQLIKMWIVSGHLEGQPVNKTKVRG